MSECGSASKMLHAPCSDSSRIFATEAGAARKSGRRCTSVSAAARGSQLQHPVERGIAAAENHQPLAVESRLEFFTR